MISVFAAFFFREARAIIFSLSPDISAKQDVTLLQCLWILTNTLLPEPHLSAGSADSFPVKLDKDVVPLMIHSDPTFCPFEGNKSKLRGNSDIRIMSNMSHLSSDLF